MKRLTKNPWFAPRKYTGWSWTPITWQGWVATAVYMGLLIFVINHLADRGILIVIGGFSVITVIFMIFAYLTGSKPGGGLGWPKGNK